MRQQAEALEDLAALLRPDHAATARSVAASLRTVADGKLPVVPAPSTGYRLIYLGDHMESVDPVTCSLLPAMLHVLSVGAKIISFGQVTADSPPYILTDRPIGQPDRVTQAGPYANRCSRVIEGCSVEWTSPIFSH